MLSSYGLCFFKGMSLFGFCFYKNRSVDQLRFQVEDHEGESACESADQSFHDELQPFDERSSQFQSLQDQEPEFQEDVG